MAEEDSKKKLELILAQLDREFGRGSVMRLGNDNIEPWPSIPTGALSLDMALGIGGLPRGRMVEISGMESTGKSTVALSVVAQAQQMGLECVYIDIENGLDPNYMHALGLNLDTLLVSQPDNAEQALTIVERLVRSGEIGVIVVDSVAALVPTVELDGDMGQSVTSDTPIYVRDKLSKCFDIIPIEDLYHGDKEFGPNRYSGKYTKLASKEILTHEGWQEIQAVWKKINKDNREIVGTRTSTGYVKTTPDHSLFVNGEEKSPNELEVFDRLDQYTEIELVNRIEAVTEDIAWLLGFYVAEGSTPRTLNSNRFEVCNTQKDLINQCKEIIDKHFLTKAEIRLTETQDTWKDLYVLDCSTCPELGFLMQTCITENSHQKRVPKFILHSSEKLKRAFLQGFWEGDGSSVDRKRIDKPRKYHNNSMVAMAGIQYLNRCLGIRTNVVISPNRPEQITLSENQGRVIRKENEILQFYTIKAPEFVWDITTTTGTFVNALGDIVCHNSHMGLQARLMSQALRKLNNITAETQTLIIWINQIRMKIGVMFGNPETSPGGMALRFYCSVRIDLRKREDIKDKEGIVTGLRVKAKVIKNKMAPALRITEFDILYGRGVNTLGCIVDMAIEKGIITKKASWLAYQDQQFQGREKVILALASDLDLADRLKGQILAG